MDNIFEKISSTLILLKIFDIYFFCYLATNEKIAITHLWHAIEHQTMYHLIAKDKVAEQHILGKYSNCNSFGVTAGDYNLHHVCAYVRAWVPQFSLKLLVTHFW